MTENRCAVDKNRSCLAAGFYALSMITVTMGDNVFVSGVLTALIEIPSYLFCLAFMDRIGRKPICVLTFLLTGLTCIPAAFAPGNLQIALALIGNFLLMG